MFNFTTQTVYNAVSTTGAKKNLWVAASGKKPAVRIGNTRFDKDQIIDIQVKLPTNEALASVTFDMSKILLAEGAEQNEITARVALYVSLSMNSQDSFYANDLVYKGKPFFVEFYVKKGDTAAVVAKRVAANAKKFNLFVAQEKLIDVTADGGNVTFTGVNGYQQFKAASLQKYDEDAIPVDCCATHGDFIEVVKGVPVAYTTSAAGAVTSLHKKLDENGEKVDLADDEVEILPGLEAFGDFNWIIHNLRLPTAANTNFWATTKEEMPIAGSQYTQFIIRMITERDGIAGGVLGQRATTVTTHVLYVATGAASTAVQNAFTTLLGDDAATKIKTDADTALQTPYN